MVGVSSSGSSSSVDPIRDGGCHARGGELLVLVVLVVMIVVVIGGGGGRGGGQAVVEVEMGRAGGVGGREVTRVVVGEGVVPLTRHLSYLSLDASIGRWSRQSRGRRSDRR